MDSKKTTKICYIIAIILLIVVLGVLVAGYVKKLTTDIPNPIVTMEVENFGTIKMELYPDQAPETVKNFVKLVQNGFYNDLTFHRIIKDFMIQGGDPSGDGTGSAKLSDLYNNEDENATYKYANGSEAKGSDDYNIPGEFVANGYTKNTLNLTEGTLAMARTDYTRYSSTLSSESYNSGCSQFFIMTSNDNTSLSGYYTGFGKVIEGMDVVHKIAEVECKSSSDDDENETSASSEKSIPVETVKIKTATVDTQGVDYEMPIILEPFDYNEWFSRYYGINTSGN